VIRLCTNEKRVTEFYNQIDEVLEFNLEVLDDYLDEAKEVNKFNKWLNYALPMRKSLSLQWRILLCMKTANSFGAPRVGYPDRCREFGYHNRLFDLLGMSPIVPQG
jgi:hypothetical protein